MRYEVCGKRETLEHAPGEQFEADLDPVMEARLIAGGHIRRVPATLVERNNASSTYTPPMSGGTLTNAADPDQA